MKYGEARVEGEEESLIENVFNELELRISKGNLFHNLAPP